MEPEFVSVKIEPNIEEEFDTDQDSQSNLEEELDVSQEFKQEIQDTLDVVLSEDFSEDGSSNLELYVGNGTIPSRTKRAKRDQAANVSRQTNKRKFASKHKLNALKKVAVINLSEGVTVPDTEERGQDARLKVVVNMLREAIA
uniref:(California timema) hypothetical protein n=1 Tax=Timema californicum TaxID=61474 RepID=A0A7R9JFH4_TIMCA|nr:unnamed protein product [Timema californicum]